LEKVLGKSLLFEGGRDPGVLARCRSFSRAQEILGRARQRAEKQQEYYSQKAKQPPKTKLKPFTSEEREARRRLIGENRKKKEAEIETDFENLRINIIFLLI